MSMSNCTCRASCTLAALISSIIIGVIAAFLRITAVITVTPAFLWTLFGIATVYLAIIFATIPRIRLSTVCEGFCSSLSALLVGIIGTVLTAVILLAIEFVATSIIGAIITGALLFFFFLIITTTACLIRCLISCDS